MERVPQFMKPFIWNITEISQQACIDPLLLLLYPMYRRSKEGSEWKR